MSSSFRRLVSFYIFIGVILFVIVLTVMSLPHGAFEATIFVTIIWLFLTMLHFSNKGSNRTLGVIDTILGSFLLIEILAHLSEYAMGPLIIQMAVIVFTVYSAGLMSLGVILIMKKPAREPVTKPTVPHVSAPAVPTERRIIVRCPSCGREVHSTYVFCPNCGAQIQE
jgi:hypothetical protein